MFFSFFDLYMFYWERGQPLIVWGFYLRISYFIDCFANFAKIIVRLVPSGERLSICWVGGNLGIAPAAGASLFTAC